MWKYYVIKWNPSPTDELFFLVRPRGPSRSAGLLSMLSFYEPTAFDFVQLSKVTSGAHIKISQIRYGASGISILSTSAAMDSSIYPISSWYFSSFAVEEKVFLLFFKKKERPLCFFSHGSSSSLQKKKAFNIFFSKL